MLTASKFVTEVSRQTYVANKRTSLLLDIGVQAGLSHWSVSNRTLCRLSLIVKLCDAGSITWRQFSFNYRPTLLRGDFMSPPARRLDLMQRDLAARTGSASTSRLSSKTISTLIWLPTRKAARRSWTCFQSLTLWRATTMPRQYCWWI